jgi:hypothetical protein
MRHMQKDEQKIWKKENNEVGVKRGKRVSDTEAGVRRGMKVKS